MPSVSPLTTQVKQNKAIAILLLIIFFMIVFLIAHVINSITNPVIIRNSNLLKEPFTEVEFINHLNQQYAYIYNNSRRSFYKLILILYFIYIFWIIISVSFHNNLISFFCNSRILTRREESRVYNILENLCIVLGERIPSLQIIETEALNAFASGLFRVKSSITITRGLLETLSDEELEAVLAHELTHIRNADIIVKFVSNIIIECMFQIVNIPKSIGFRKSKYEAIDDHNEIFIFIVIYGLILLLNLIKFFIALLLSMGINYIFLLLISPYLSKEAEFLADRGAVDLTKNPEALKSALQKMSSSNNKTTGIPVNILKMCVVNPKQSRFSFLSTHPGLEDRLNDIDRYTEELKLKPFS